MKFLRYVALLCTSLPTLVPALTISAVLGGAVVLSSGCSSIDKYDTSKPEGLFAQGELYEKDERYEEAVAKYTEVKNKFPYSKLATEAELKIADVNFKREAYVEAQSAYQLFKEFHPKHPQADYVTYRLALSYFKQLPDSIDRDLSVADKAILYFDEVISSYSTSQYAEDAKVKKSAALKMLALKEMYIANFYAKHKQFDSALKRYETVLKTYPNLGLDAEALYGAARSAIESGEKERGEQHLKNLYSLYPNTDEARRAKHEF
jgi:outer membrane protein assembly factor BamD